MSQWRRDICVLKLNLTRWRSHEKTETLNVASTYLLLSRWEVGSVFTIPRQAAAVTLGCPRAPWFNLLCYFVLPVASLVHYGWIVWQTHHRTNLHSRELMFCSAFNVFSLCFVSPYLPTVFSWCRLRKRWIWSIGLPYPKEDQDQAIWEGGSGIREWSEGRQESISPRKLQLKLKETMNA
jgi:hypothetical protein